MLAWLGDLCRKNRAEIDSKSSSVELTSTKIAHSGPNIDAPGLESDA